MTGEGVAETVASGRKKPSGKGEGEHGVLFMGGG